MWEAVHSDRAGRVFIADDYGATALDGPAPAGLERAIPLPAGAQLVPLVDRAAVGLDRRAQPRSLGPARWALAALLRPGHVRTHLPSVEAAADAAPLEPLAYAAVAADPHGELVVAAVALAPVSRLDGSDPSAAINHRLRAEPSNRLLRQLARCAKEYGCAAARNAFVGRSECALPLRAPGSDGAAPTVALRRRDERAPLDPIALRVTADDAAAVAIAHLSAGGTSVSFGHACEGEPLERIRDVADVAAKVRGAVSSGEIVLRTSGSSAAALGRAADAGIDRVVILLASAHGPTSARIHRPAGHRWPDVRAALREAPAPPPATPNAPLHLPGPPHRNAEVA